MKQFKWVAIAAAVALIGCSTSVSRLSDDGKSDEIIFPDIAKQAWIKEGIFPNIENLRKVAPGMTKDQLYALFGPPHFREGLGKVREWDYIFNFRNDGGNGVETCQYKVVFAPDMRVRSVHWKPESCANRLQQPGIPTQTVIEKQIISEPMRIRLAGDGLFEFDKYDLADLLPGGMEKLNQVAADLLAAGEIEQIKIVGHTDRLGTEAYNRRLSLNRANTIRQYLISKGIPADRIKASGAGESMPLVECKQKKRDAALIRCLQPNRRFEIEAWMAPKQ
ncbi:MAG TPA: OmpA family protein [Gallionella sp.]|nr:OmpA family protein [Gallionella sp.]